MFQASEDRFPDAERLKFPQFSETETAIRRDGSFSTCTQVAGGRDAGGVFGQDQRRRIDGGKEKHQLTVKAPGIYCSQSRLHPLIQNCFGCQSIDPRPGTVRTNRTPPWSDIGDIGSIDQSPRRSGFPSNAHRCCPPGSHVNPAAQAIGTKTYHAAPPHFMCKRHTSASSPSSVPILVRMSPRLQTPRLRLR
jgi:hypothetical protein